MKLPEEIISQGGFRIGSQSAFAEAIVRDCITQYGVWVKSSGTALTFPEWLLARYSLEPK